MSGIGLAASLIGLLLLAIVFAIIVVHELGHALMARRFGVHTRDILLLPIGGIASLERIPERPAHELAIAIVGPLINLAIAAVLWIAISIGGGVIDPMAATSVWESLLAQILWINVILAG